MKRIFTGAVVAISGLVVSLFTIAYVLWTIKMLFYYEN